MTSEKLSEKLLLSTYEHNEHSKEWQRVRKLHLIKYPTCAVCGVRNKLGAPLTVHHIIPVHVDPALEFEPSNLISLCEKPANHHLFIGHLMDYMSHNKHVVSDATLWRTRIKSRPKWKRTI